MNETKLCSKCKLEKSLLDFYFRTDRNKYRNECIPCLNEKKKIYNTNNLDKIKESRLNFRKDNRNKLAKAQKTYRENNPEKIKDSFNHWKLNNINVFKEYQKKYKQENKLIRNLKEKKRKLNDPVYRLNHNIRSLIRQSFTKKGFSKKSRTYQILECSFEEFKLHLESKFEPWMSWDNYGNPKDGIFELNKTWDIDHIIPTSSAITEEDIIKLNHYTNLKPLCSYMNRFIKRDLFLE